MRNACFLYADCDFSNVNEYFYKTEIIVNPSILSDFRKAQKVSTIYRIYTKNVPDKQKLLSYFPSAMLWWHRWCKWCNFLFFMILPFVFIKLFWKYTTYNTFILQPYLLSEILHHKTPHQYATHAVLFSQKMLIIKVMILIKAIQIVLL